MKLPHPLLLLAGVFISTAPLAAQDFEGRIKMEMRDGRNAMPIDYSFKKDRVRVDVSVEKMTMTSLMDLQKNELVVLMPEQNMYMVMPVREVVEAAGKANKGTALVKTDETETILGYHCTKYISTDRGTTTEIWAAEGIGAFISRGKSSPMKPAARNAWEEELLQKGFFPLRVVSKNRGGKETSRMEVVAIEKQSLPDSHFAIPEGYQRFEMGGMMKGLMKGLIPGAK